MFTSSISGGVNGGVDGDDDDSTVNVQESRQYAHARPHTEDEQQNRRNFPQYRHLLAISFSSKCEWGRVRVMIAKHMFGSLVNFVLI